MDDAVPVQHHPRRIKGPSHLPQPRSKLHSAATSLVDLCRDCITTHFEQYPTAAFGICDPDEWQALVSLVHSRTQPATGTGGLDGSGRLVPAVSVKYLQALEESNDHLSDCAVADELLWKDCVEYKFRRGGLTRPVALQLPWPMLIEDMQAKANALICDSQAARQAVDELQKTPMNVSLLKESGVGKMVKKVMKRNPELRARLNGILNGWMEMAARNGVAVSVANAPNSKLSTGTTNHQEDDLEIAETCQTWRQLFAALSCRNEHLRERQGKRMREVRNNLAKTRPKLVKVRPAAKPKHDRVLEHSALSPAHAKSKMVAKIRQEVGIQAARTTIQRPKSTFGEAVAFAATSKKGAAHKKRKIGGTLHKLGGGKSMKVPTRATGRQFAPKWKKK